MDPWKSSYPGNAIDANITASLWTSVVHPVIPDMNTKLIVPNWRALDETMCADALPPLTLRISIGIQTDFEDLASIMVLSLLCLSLRRQVAYRFFSKLLPLRELARKRGSSSMAKFVTKL